MYGSKVFTQPAPFWLEVKEVKQGVGSNFRIFFASAWTCRA